MNVVTALNETYVPYTYVMLYSLFLNNKRKIHVYLLQDDLSEESEKNLTNLCNEYGNEISFLKMNREMFDSRLLSTHDWSMETCFRLAMNDVLPKNLDRLIYLDGDMIINRDISDLYELPFSSDKHLIATHDMTMTPDSGDVYGDLHTEVFNRLIRENKYFNAGMIVMDYAYLKDHYGFSDYMKMAQDLNFEIFAPDQDLLNLMHEDQVEYVDAWQYDLFACNAFIKNYDYKKIKKEVSIIHYVGEKPWRGGSHFHYDVECLWWDYAKQTIYALALKDDFLDTYSKDSKFYDAILQARIFNRNLKDDLEKTMRAFQKLYQRATGKPMETIRLEEGKNGFTIPPECNHKKLSEEEKENLVYEIIGDAALKEYVDTLRKENESLQAQVDDALKAYQTLKTSLES